MLFFVEQQDCYQQTIRVNVKVTHAHAHTHTTTMKWQTAEAQNEQTTMCKHMTNP